MGGCGNMLPECQRRFEIIEERQQKLLTDYVTDMESNRQEMKDLKEEVKGVKTKMDNTHDSVLGLAKDMEHLTKTYEEDRKDRKDNRKWIITTWITTGLSLIAIAINLILNLLK